MLNLVTKRKHAVVLVPSRGNACRQDGADTGIAGGGGGYPHDDLCVHMEGFFMKPMTLRSTLTVLAGSATLLWRRPLLLKWST